MILALPFVSLIAWALFKEAYQAITILVLMALFCPLLPKRKPEAHPESRTSGTSGRSV